MVCLDGCPESGEYNWQDPHPVGDGMHDGGHNTIYCTRACLSMIAAQGGCNLSQDRITYHIYEEMGSSRGISELGHAGDPFKDLAHGTGTWNADTIATLNWMYGASSASSHFHTLEVIDDVDPSDMDSVKDFIVAGRPVIRNVPGHSTLIDGYAEVHRDGGMLEGYIHVLDPWNVGDVQWISLLSAPAEHWYVFPPTTGSPMRNDEPEIGMDSDGDLLCDFDEVHRFETDPHNMDTDGDDLDDYADMLGYLFQPDGSYDLRERDIDGDEAPKELDPDNDHAEDNGMNDGCEDANQDGWYNSDGEESDNFVEDDDFSVLPRHCYRGFINLNSQASGPYPLPTVYTRENLLIEASQPLSSSEYVHECNWVLSSDPIVIHTDTVSVGGLASGSGEGMARIEIEVDEDGHYVMTTDCQPRVGHYTVTTSGPGGISSSTYPIYLAFADHHYGYVGGNTPPEVWAMLEAMGPVNVYEGEVTTDEQGSRIAGFDDFSMPGGLGLSGHIHREWQIWLD